MPSQYLYRTGIEPEAQRHIQQANLPELMHDCPVYAEMKNTEDLITLWSYNYRDSLLAYGVGNLWEIQPCEIDQLNVALFDLLKRHGIKNVHAKGLGPAMDQTYRFGSKKAPRPYHSGVKEIIYPPPADFEKVAAKIIAKNEKLTNSGV